MVSVLTVIASIQFTEIPIYFFGSFFVSLWVIASVGTVLSWGRSFMEGDAGEAASVKATSRWPDLGGFVIVLFTAVHLFFPSLPVLRFFTRESVNRVVCNANMKYINSALHEYMAANHALPKATNGDPAVSWRVAILPFLGEQPLFEQYDTHVPWDSVSNEPVAKTQLWYWRCPAAVAKRDPELMQDHQGRLYSHYALPSGPQTIGAGVNPGETSDGLGNTILLVESSGLKIVWTEPRDADTASLPPGVNLPGPRYGESPGWISSNHPLGAYVMMADGSIRYLLEDINPRVLRSLTKIDARDMGRNH